MNGFYFIVEIILVTSLERVTFSCNIFEVRFFVQLTRKGLHDIFASQERCL